MVNLISFKKLALVGLMLIAGSAGSMSYAQNTNNNEVSLVVSGEGPTKDEATKVALRSAIEQTYGTFVSSNSTILNDNLVKDEIVSVSTGNIKSFNYLSTQETNGKWSVSVQAIVSIGKLIEYAKSKGSEAELAGATFAMNMKLQQLNKKNQDIALEHLLSQLKPIIPTIFDYELEVGEPKYVDSEKLYFVPITISVIANKNINACYELFSKTLKALSVPPSEVEMYLKQGLIFCRIGLVTKKNDGLLNWLYLHDSKLTKEYDTILDFLKKDILNNICNFSLSDGINTFFPKYLTIGSRGDTDVDFTLIDRKGRILNHPSHDYSLRFVDMTGKEVYGEEYSELKTRNTQTKKDTGWIRLPLHINIDEYEINKWGFWDFTAGEDYERNRYDLKNQSPRDIKYDSEDFPFFTPGQEGKKITEIKVLLPYTLDDLSKISKFNITPTYKK